MITNSRSFLSILSSTHVEPGFLCFICANYCRGSPAPFHLQHRLLPSKGFQPLGAAKQQGLNFRVKNNAVYVNCEPVRVCDIYLGNKDMV